MSEIKVKELKRPPATLLGEIYDTVEDIVREEILGDSRRNLSNVITPRLKGDIIREFVAHAFLRTAFQNGYRAIDELEYTDEDVDFVMDRANHFVEFALNPLIAESRILTPKISKKDRAKELILKLLSDGVEHRRERVVSHVHGLINISKGRIDTALKELLAEKRIQKLRYGFYWIIKDRP